MMSVKVYDGQGRWRSKTVSFRCSSEEDSLIERFVRLSGLTKQDYIISRLLQKDIVVVGNPRVHKALREQMSEILRELKRFEQSSECGEDFIALVQTVTEMYGGLGNV